MFQIYKNGIYLFRFSFTRLTTFSEQLSDNAIWALLSQGGGSDMWDSAGFVTKTELFESSDDTSESVSKIGILVNVVQS